MKKVNARELTLLPEQEYALSGEDEGALISEVPAVDLLDAVAEEKGLCNDML